MTEATWGKGFLLFIACVCGLTVALLAEEINLRLGLTNTKPSPGGCVAFLSSTIGFLIVFFRPRHHSPGKGTQCSGLMGDQTASGS